MSSRLQHLVQPAAEPTPAARLRLGLALHDDGVAVERGRLRREHPHWSEETLDAAIRAWLTDRPPPGFGCPGLRCAKHRFAKWL
jgi:hypothetical protein